MRGAGCSGAGLTMRMYTFPSFVRILAAFDVVDKKFTVAVANFPFDNRSEGPECSRVLKMAWIVQYEPF